MRLRHARGLSVPRSPRAGRRGDTAARRWPAIALLASTFVAPSAFAAFNTSSPGGCPVQLAPSGSCPIEEDGSGSAFRDAGTAPGGGTPGTAVGNPIDLITGVKRQSERDHVVDGVPLSFVRHYSSADTDANVGLGQGWRHTYAVRLTALADGRRLVVDATGRHVLFEAPQANVDPETGAPGPLVHAGLLASDGHLVSTGGDSVWTIPDGRRLSFRGSFLTRIDPPGHHHLALYYRERRLASVTDETGRAIRFEYAPGRVGLGGYDERPFGQHAGHLSAVVLPGGVRVEYDYDERRNLTRARFADGTTRTYHYESPLHRSHLTGLTERTGVRFATWEYDERGRAILSTHADGIGRVDLRIEAPEDLPGGVVGEEGRTTVVDATGGESVYRWRRDPRTGVSQLLEGTGPGCASCPPTGRRHAYDASGALSSTSRVDAAGRVLGTRRFERDTRGRSSRIVETGTDARGEAYERVIERREYDGDGYRVRLLVRPSVDPAGEHEIETRGPRGVPKRATCASTRRAGRSRSAPARRAP